ncbi:hypothetical protein WJX84_004988, partial [Apatococcus fuscideae]
MVAAGCMHTAPVTRSSALPTRSRPRPPVCRRSERRQSRDDRHAPQESQHASSTTRRSLLAGLVLAPAALQASGPCPGAPQAAAAALSQDVRECQAGKLLTLPEKQVLEQNRRRQAQNSAPRDFPSFARQGFDIKILADGYSTSNGLIYKDFRVGEGECPVDGQQVLFHYNAYNENGGKIDSSYNKGKPAQTRLGTKGLIPGFEQGIKEMKIGGRRRLVVPPELGPPVGPSTFFSAKQCEVFDVELLDVKNC